MRASPLAETIASTQFLQHDPNRANRIVISRNRIIDHFRIGVRINDRNDWNV